MTRRAKVEYIDPDIMNPPGKCLRDDGIYRRRNGLPDRPDVLTPGEIARLRPGTLTPRVTEADRAMRPGRYNKAEAVFRAPQEG